MFEIDTNMSIFRKLSVAFGLEALAYVQKIPALGSEDLATNLQALQELIFEQFGRRTDIEASTPVPISEREEAYALSFAAFEKKYPEGQDGAYDKKTMRLESNRLSTEYGQIEAIKRALAELPDETVIHTAFALLRAFENNPVAAQNTLSDRTTDYPALADEARTICLILGITAVERALQNAAELTDKNEHIPTSLAEMLPQFTTDLAQALQDVPGAPDLTSRVLNMIWQALPMGAVRLLECFTAAGLEIPAQPTVTEILNVLAPVDYPRAAESLVTIIEAVSMPPPGIRAIAKAALEKIPSLTYHLLLPLVETNSADAIIYRMLAQSQTRVEGQTQTDWILEGLKRKHATLWKDYLERIGKEAAPLIHESRYLLPNDDGLDTSNPALEENRPLWELSVKVLKEARQLVATTNDQVGFVIATTYANVAAVFSPNKISADQHMESVEFLLANRKKISFAALLLSIEPATFAASYFINLFPAKGKRIAELHRGLCNALGAGETGKIRVIMPFSEEVLGHLVYSANHPGEILDSFDRLNLLNGAEADMYRKAKAAQRGLKL